MTVLGYLPKLKRRQGLAFLHIFGLIFPYVFLYLQSFSVITFFTSQDIKQNALFNSCLDN